MPSFAEFFFFLFLYIRIVNVSGSFSSRANPFFSLVMMMMMTMDNLSRQYHIAGRAKASKPSSFSCHFKRHTHIGLILQNEAIWSNNSNNDKKAQLSRPHKFSHCHLRGMIPRPISCEKKLFSLSFLEIGLTHLDENAKEGVHLLNEQPHPHAFEI